MKLSDIEKNTEEWLKQRNPVVASVITFVIIASIIFVGLVGSVMLFYVAGKVFGFLGVFFVGIVYFVGFVCGDDVYRYWKYN